MEQAEALDLANKLADAVERLQAIELQIAESTLQQGDIEDVHSG